MNPFQNFANKVTGYMAGIPSWDEFSNALEVIRRERERQNSVADSPFGGVPFEQPVRTRYGIAPDRETLDYMVSIARQKREEEMKKEEVERMLRENWEKEKWNYPYRGVELGVGFGS